MVDGISVVSFDVATNGASAQSPVSATQVSVFDVARFDALQQQVAAPNGVNHLSHSMQSSQSIAGVHASEPASSSFKSALRLLESLNSNSDKLGADALRFSAENKNLTPGEMLHLTVQAHQFMFKSEMTATVANKTSDGVQQLFRQQS